MKHGSQFCHPDWLEQHVVHLAGEATVQAVRTGLRRHGDDRGAAVRQFAFANLDGCVLPAP